ncbi:MAG: FAD-dependent oxidoreductase, partial [Bdellovibrionales bacterium]|nr:FAD-dependent oxidoreductase [Ramlibacter sp.]
FFGKYSPVRFRFKVDPAQWSWGLRFLAACTSTQAAKGTRQLLRLAMLSRDVLDSWQPEESLRFNFHRSGKLVLCPDQNNLDHQAGQVRLQSYAGTAQFVLDREECLRREPSLARYHAFVGGIWTPSECVGDPHAFCTSLAAMIASLGGQTLFQTEVQQFVVREGLARAVVTNRGQLEADAFVLCAGIRARSLAKQLGEALPIYPIKGYSLTMQMRQPAQAPTVSVTDLAKKMVLAPLNGHLRVAAMAEVVGDDLQIPPARVERILAAVEEIYPGLCDPTESRPWAGLRPATPTSVPIIRPSRVSNVFLNVGHGALGFTLAAGSARVIGALLCSRDAESVLPRFSDSLTPPYPGFEGRA